MESCPFLELPRDEGIIKGYRLIRHLGGGAQGQIYLVKNETLNRNVALKLFGPSFSSLFFSLQECRQEAQNVDLKKAWNEYLY